MDENRKKELIKEKQNQVDNFVGRHSVNDQAKIDILRGATFEAFTDIKGLERAIVRLDNKVFTNEESMLAYLLTEKPMYVSEVARTTPDIKTNDKNDTGTETSLNPVLAGIDKKIAASVELTVEEAKTLDKLCSKDSTMRATYRKALIDNFEKTTFGGQKYTGVYK